MQHPIDYARVVSRFGNEEDLGTVKLDDILSGTMVMMVSVTASTTPGNALPPSELAKVVVVRFPSCPINVKKIVFSFTFLLHYILIC